MKTIIIDIDGTIADVEARLSKAIEVTGKKGGNKFWDAFLGPEFMELDTPIPGARDQVKRWFDKGYKLVYLSGRRDTSRNATERWLNVYGFPPGEVILRPKGVRTKGYKIEKIAQIKRRGDYIICALGDSDDDIEIYNQFKIPRVEKVERNQPWTRRMCFD